MSCTKQKFYDLKPSGKIQDIVSLNEYRFVPARDEEARKLQAEVLRINTEVAEIKKEKNEKKASCHCPFIDPITNLRCTKNMLIVNILEP